MTEPRPVYITEHIPLLEYLAAAERLMHPAVTIIDGDCWDACTLLPNEIDILTLIDEAAANGGVLKEDSDANNQ